MINGSSAYTADDTTRANGSTPSSAARSPDASTTALAPSLSGVELAAVICVVPGCTGNAASCSAVVSSRMNSSSSTVRAGVFFVAAICTGMISLASRPEFAGGLGVLLRAQRERVDLLASQPVAVGHVLRGLDHGNVGVAGQQLWIRWAASTGPHGVKQNHRSARGERRVALHVCPPGTRHRLHTARNAYAQVTRFDCMGQLDRRAQRRSTEPVDRRSGNAIGKTRRQGRPARHVAHSFVGWIDAASDDIFD